MVSDPDKLSHINLEASNKFCEQQKWLVNLNYLKKLFKSIYFRNIVESNKFNLVTKFSCFRSLLKLVKISETASYDLQRKSKRKQQQQNAILSPKFSIFKPPKIVATCFSARKPGFYFLNAYFLVFLITFIAFPVFSIDIKSPHFRLTTSYTILLTSVSCNQIFKNN